MLLDVDAEAAWIYKLAGAEADAPPGALRLAARLFGDGCVERVDGRLLRGGDACLCRVHGKVRIFTRRGLPDERTLFAVAHEIAEWRLSEIDYREEDRESVANALGAALLIPRAALRATAVVDFATLAEDFQTTQTCAALRVGEVTGRPLAVVSPQLVRVRGEEWVWPEPPVIRRLAKTKAPLPPDVERVDITDEPKRVVLLVG